MGQPAEKLLDSGPQAGPVDYDAIVVGAGVSGLYQVYRLREEGFTVRAFDAASDVGGTWYWNRYPGARFDSQAYAYQYLFSQELIDEWDWSERFPGQPEIERYLQFVADKFDLRDAYRFDTHVDSAHYDEASLRWRVRTDRGDDLTCRFFISCAGVLSVYAAQVPFAGADKFRGQICHTARWPRDGASLAGKRVGVVGTGATGIQVVQTIAAEVGQLTVFQRSANYTIAIDNPAYDKADNEALRKEFPEIRQKVFQTFGGFDYDLSEESFYDLSEQQLDEKLWALWKTGTLEFWIGSFMEVFTDKNANAYVAEFVKARIRERVQDPELAERLVPADLDFGTRRVALENGYYEAFNRDNVELVDVKADPIAEITETGLRLESGEQHELDVIVLATGFDASSGGHIRYDIRGRGDQSLKDKWDRDLRCVLGMQVHGFPNLFTVSGPLASAGAFCNYPVCAQQEVDWVTDAIKFVRDRGQHAIEPTLQKEDEWVAQHDEIANQTLLPHNNTWYMGDNIPGKPRRLIGYIGGVGNFNQICEDVKNSGYEGFALS